MVQFEGSSDPWWLGSMLCQKGTEGSVVCLFHMFRYFWEWVCLLGREWRSVMVCHDLDSCALLLFV